MPLDPLTSVCIGIVWALVWVGVGLSSELAALARALRDRYFRGRG